MRSNSMLAAPLRALPWKGMGVLLAVCLVNALRRNVNSRLLRDDPAEWLVDVRSATATGAIVAVLVVLAVMAASRPSWRAAWRYAATLTAALAASALGVMLLLGLESGWTYTAEFMQRRVGAVEMFANTWPR